MENDAENDRIPSRLLIPRILIFVNKERATRALCFIIHVIVVIIGCDEENKKRKEKKIFPRRKNKELRNIRKI